MDELKTRFIVTGEPRSGTTWICDLLNSHPDALCWREPFHPHWKARRKAHRRFWHDEDYFYGKMDRKEENNKGTYTRPRLYVQEKIWSLRARAVGWKCLFTHSNQYQDLRKYFRRMGDELHTVVMIRNPIRSHLSACHARMTGQYEVMQRGNVKARPAMTLTVPGCVEAVESMERNMRNLSLNCSNILKVYYDQLWANHYETMGQVLDFLQLRHWACDAHTYKLQPGDIRQHVLNWDELYAGMPEQYRHYMDDTEIL